MDDAPGRPMGKARVPLTPQQRDALQDLYLAVPKQVQVHHEWQSPAGQKLLRMIYDLIADAKVPLRWIAVALNIDERMLQQTVNRTAHWLEKERREQDHGSGP